MNGQKIQQERNRVNAEATTNVRNNPHFQRQLDAALLRWDTFTDQRHVGGVDGIEFRDIATRNVMKSRYFGISERQRLDGTREIYVGPGGTVWQNELAWCQRESKPLFLIRANNRTQVRNWIGALDMSVTNLEAERLRKQADRLLERAAFLDSLPDEPEFINDDNPVIFFTKTFGGGKTYTYAAVKTDAGWYTTGPRSPKGYTWRDLIRWIVEDEAEPPRILIGTEWEDLP